MEAYVWPWEQYSLWSSLFAHHCILVRCKKNSLIHRDWSNPRVLSVLSLCVVTQYFYTTDNRERETTVVNFSSFPSICQFRQQFAGTHLYTSTVRKDQIELGTSHWKSQVQQKENSSLTHWNIYLHMAQSAEPKKKHYFTCSSSVRGWNARGRTGLDLQMDSNITSSSGILTSSLNSASISSLPYRYSASLNLGPGEGGGDVTLFPLDKARSLQTFT